MGTVTILWNNKADMATLSGGSWQSALPLSNLLTRNLTKVARTSDLSLGSTKLRVSLAEIDVFHALVLGPTNLTVNYAYKITWFSDASFTTPIDNTGWINPIEASVVDVFDIPWEASYFWTGVRPFDDDYRGIWVVHVFSDAVTAQYFQIEIDDSLNVDGYIQAGRLFLASYWKPSVNYATSNNGLSFRNSTIESSTLSGGKYYWRRINPRNFSLKIPILPKNEVFDNAYRLLQQAGYDKEVCVIPDNEDTTYMQKRTFLATITQADPLAQLAGGYASFGFNVEEIIQ